MMERQIWLPNSEVDPERVRGDSLSLLQSRVAKFDALLWTGTIIVKIFANLPTNLQPILR